MSGQEAAGAVFRPIFVFGGILMKRTAALLLALVIMLVSGCALSVPEGFSEVKRAKELYEKLGSGRLTMTDVASGETLMEFSFFINKKDEMIFSYISQDENGTEGAYSDGAQFFYKNRGEEKWRIISADDESYLYNLYSKTYRYPYARGSIFFLDGTSVESAQLTENADGSLTVRYDYDPEKLNKNAVGMLDGVSEFYALSAVYEIAADGCMAAFTETGSVADEQGERSDLSIRLTVSDPGNVYDIPSPVGELAE